MNLFKNLPDSITFQLDSESGRFYVHSIEANMRDSAFLCYFLLKTGRATQVVQFLKGRLWSVLSSDLLDQVYWLWVVGEYLITQKDPDFFDETKGTIQIITESIQQGWNQPCRHWLDETETGVFLSHIAIAYGALQAVNQSFKSETVRQTLKTMREFAFQKFIKDGKVISKLGDTTIFSEIIVTAIPFGVFGIEDRILIEALFVVEEHLITEGVRFSLSDTYYGGCTRPYLACLLAWYYSEKGDMSRAKTLLDHVAHLLDSENTLYEVNSESAKEEIYLDYWKQQNGGIKESPLSYILFAIASHNLEIRVEGGVSDTSSKVVILHDPSGTDDPYFFNRNERFPRFPAQDEKVFVNIVTQPFQPAQLVYVECAVNGRANEPIKMEAVTSDKGEKYWQACLGSFQAFDQVEYGFKVLETKDTTTVPTYSFSVRNWVSLQQIIRIDEDTDSIRFTFEAVAPRKSYPTLALNLVEGKFVRLYFYFTHDVERITDIKFEKVEERLMKFFTDRQQWPQFQIYQKHGVSFIDLLLDGHGVVHKLKFNLSFDAGEKWLGMGERFSQLEYHGQNVDNYVYNQYRDQGLKTYLPVPLAISSKQYGFYLDTTRYSNFHFGTTLNDLCEIEVDLDAAGPELTSYIFLGEPLEIIQQYCTISGKPTLPPKWVFGPWMSSNNWDSQSEVDKQVALTNQYQIPSTVIVLEQWSDEATFYIFNDAQYKPKDGNDHFCYDDFQFPEWGRWPNPKKMVENLHANGLKVLLWQIPIHKYMYGVPHHQRDLDEKAFLENSYQVNNADGLPYTIPYNWFKDCHILDFTNPKAKEWWFNKRLYLLQDIGIDGFKTDGGECVFGREVQFYNGKTGDEMRNQYPNAYIGSYYEFVQQHVEGGGITFSRAGYAGAQKFPLHWAGDERSTYPAFRASVIAGLTSGMSGIPFWGWDLGGFHGDIPTAELFIRSTQMAAFCPVMQYHAETKGELNQDRTPWNIAERTNTPIVLDIYKKYADLRMNLLPYIYEQAMLSSHLGVPMMRAMILQYPADPSCIQLTEQYMFGESLLVAPIVEEGAFTKNVYFPQGSWISLFTQHEVFGSKLEQLKVELDEMVVYMKGNSVVPLNLTNNYNLFAHVGNSVDQYEELCFYVYIQDEVSYRFHDDLNNEMDLQIIKQAARIDVMMRRNFDQAVTLILRNIFAVQSVHEGEFILRKTEVPHNIDAQTYCICNHNLYINLVGTHEKVSIII